MTTTATPDLTLVVDLSNYTGEMTPAIVAVLVAAGVTDAFVRGSLESAAMTALARRQMQALGAGGIRVHTYLWAYSNWDPAQTATDAIAAFGDLVGAGIYALDTEDTASFAGVPAAAAVVWHLTVYAALAAAGKRGLQYTADWCWTPITGNTTAVAALGIGLWNANFNGVQTLALTVPFGGWTAATGEQFADTAAIAEADSSVFSLAFLAPPAPAPDPNVPDVPDAITRVQSAITELQAGLADLATYAAARRAA